MWANGVIPTFMKHPTPFGSYTPPPSGWNGGGDNLNRGYAAAQPQPPTRWGVDH